MESAARIIKPAFFRSFLVLALLVTVSVTSLNAEGNRRTVNQRPASPAAPADYRSKNFLIHTDLPAEEARDLLERLEKMLVIISTYWASPNRSVIECYVVKDLANWPAGSLHPAGMQSVEGEVV